jgi:hypothetical protein
VFNDAVGRTARMLAPIDSTDTTFVETLTSFVNDSVYYDGSGNEIFRTTYPTSSNDVSSYY